MTTTIRISNSNTGEIWERIVPSGQLISFALIMLVWDIVPFGDYAEDAYDNIVDMAFTVGLSLDKSDKNKPDEFGCTMGVQDIKHDHYMSYRIEAERA
jgi:hypothetical protein